VFIALRRKLTLLALPTAAVVMAGSISAASASPVPSAGTVVTSAPAPVTQGIIMRDGGICDPIRHMGC
jgi:hypothetical protein